MKSGFYRVDFAGGWGKGRGAFTLLDGKVVGLDVAGVKYVGTYYESADGIAGDMRITIPPGTQLVTGLTVGPSGAVHDISMHIGQGGGFSATLPFGAVKGRLILIEPL